MESRNKNIVQSLLSGVGVATLILLLGTVLDYVFMQTLSQYIIRNCSEDCYFRYFNAIFMVVAFLSIVGGVWAAMRTYKRSSEKE